MEMAGDDDWTQRWGNQPQFVYDTNAAFTNVDKDYVLGCLRWSQVIEVDGNNPTQDVYRTGWILCYNNGRPITYADGGQTGAIKVIASGSYVTAN